MAAQFGVIKVLSEVYVNSSSDYSFGLVLYWKGKRRKAFVDIHFRDIIFPGPKEDSKTTFASNYPQYLYWEIWEGIMAMADEDKFVFHEIDRDGNKRYEPLRYHADEYWESVKSIIRKELDERNAT